MCRNNNLQVLWIQAKPKTENGDLKGLLDPNLYGKYDEVQMQRMVLAANLCTTRAARLRPTMKEVKAFHSQSFR